VLLFNRSLHNSFLGLAKGRQLVPLPHLAFPKLSCLLNNLVPEVVFKLLPLMETLDTVLMEETALHVELLIQNVWLNVGENYVNKQSIGLSNLILIENVFDIPIVVGVEGSAALSLRSSICIGAVTGVAKMHELAAILFEVSFQ
jgi:hypothetical protein